MSPRLGFWRVMRHINIPIFIPHMGCPNECVFCNQRSISGRIQFDPAEMEKDIETVLATVKQEDEAEIAFFGGSFTGIERELMIDLLERAERYVHEGRVGSIRLSTRPDYISREILDILSRYSVRTVELGLQSMNDAVLSACKRGHTAAQGKEACALVKQYGFSLVGQMMVGLPGAAPADEVDTAKTLCELFVDAARVYPTVVFEETELCRMTREGVYLPISLEEAVVRTKEVLKVFDSRGVPCIRVGLCASENLASEKVVGGANHSAVGELAMGEIFYEKMCQQLDEAGDVRGKIVVFYVPKGAISRAVGQKKKNTERIYKKYSPLRIKVLEKSELMRYNIILELL